MESDIKQQRAHIFSRRFSRNKFVELSITGVLRFFTYLVIVLAGYLFCDIAYKGSKVIFISEGSIYKYSIFNGKTANASCF